MDIGNRLEPFVDRHLIDRLDHVTLELTEPVRREVVFTADKPWEGKWSGYFTVFRDGERIRLYYRGYAPDNPEVELTCYAESRDGIHFERPSLGLHTVGGSSDNNVVLIGVGCHNFAPFLDTNPDCRPEERYKAVGGAPQLYGFVSPDGLQWKKIQEAPILTEGEFDSLNVAFWDGHARLYRCYSRRWSAGEFAGYRAIQSCTSQDFITWTKPQLNVYPSDVGPEHLYTNATVPHPGAPHILLSFPMRFVPERTKLAGFQEPGVSDALFMTSRDGVHWDRTFQEAWLRPGPDPRNWTHRNTMPAWGIIETGDEFSLYVSEHYDWPDNRIRRVTVPRNRLAGLKAGVQTGEVITKPLRIAGTDLYLNYATSAVGSVRIEAQRPDGTAIEGYTLEDMEPLFGDEFDARVTWKGKSLGQAGTDTIRLRFVLRDARVYSIQVK